MSSCQDNAWQHFVDFAKLQPKCLKFKSNDIIKILPIT